MKLLFWICSVLLILGIPLESYRMQPNKVSGRSKHFERKDSSRRPREISRTVPSSDSPKSWPVLPYSALTAMKRTLVNLNITKEIGLPSDKSNEEDLFSIGYMHMGFIANVKGLSGEVKMHLISNLINDSFLNNNTMIYLRSPRGKSLKPFRVLHSQLQKNTIHVLRLRGLMDVDLAATLKRHAVYIRKADLPDLESDEYLERDILGMHVYVNTSGVVDPMPFGRVIRIYAPEELCRRKVLAEIMHGILEIQRYDNGRFTMIPFTDEFIPTMDVEKRFMIVEPVEGLFNVTHTNPRRKKGAKKSREMVRRPSDDDGVDEEEVDDDSNSNPFFISTEARDQRVPSAPDSRSRVASLSKTDKVDGLSKTEKRKLRAMKATERRIAEKLNRQGNDSVPAEKK